MNAAAALLIAAALFLAAVFRRRLLAAERKILERERELQAAQREQQSLASLVQAKDRELQEFLYSASHDLREPLRKIMSFGDFLAEDAAGALPDSARTHLSTIIGAAKRMEELLQELLLLSRIGRQELHRGDVSMEERAKAALVDCESALPGRHAEVTWGTLPERCSGDAELISRLYRCLIDNAFKYAKASNPHIEFTAREDGGETVFGVKDDGIGFDPRYRDRIFSPFKRLHSRKEIPGNGIGLAICRRIVEKHGGTIWGESDVGKGAHFQFTLGKDSSNPSPPPESTARLAEAVRS
jgi:light-regulated signal transduction histidine kinase (bacteriophytochrome)